MGTIGSEGVVGPAAYLGLPASPNEVFMQVAGEGLRMEATALAKAASCDASMFGGALMTVPAGTVRTPAIARRRVCSARNSSDVTP